VALFRRRGAQSRAGTPREATSVDLRHLEEFAGTRRGVEGFVEPRTQFTEMTMVLVAADGEWTRRRISGPDAARKLGAKLGIPVYDVAATGYPRRMREWTARRKAAGDTGVPGLPGPSL